ncbi:MAG TPA: aminopeptidase [Gemmatimonadaceae bacterium]|nr:aminopeptidase [Gemmatimonadaceae bacterium]
MLVVLLLILLLAVATPTGRYIARAAYDEGKILAGRRPIHELVQDSTVPAPVRHKLQLVLDARRYAIDALDMRGGDSFTTYTALERDTLVLVLSAAYRDRLERYSWWFPVVGRVPYKGFFDFTEAREAEQRFLRDGYDAYLRPASAFSTLGWFNDPLLSSTLELDSVDLANTVIHELTHNTYFAPGNAVFNESFANFVGARGAEAFFLAQGDSASASRAAREWADERVLGHFWETLYARLDSAFAAHPADSGARLRVRAAIYDSARVELARTVAPQMREIPPEAVRRLRLDNAALLARRIYVTRLDLFDAVYEREGRDLRRTVARVIDVVRGAKDPYAALDRWYSDTSDTTATVDTATP